ncbi:MAG: hypothetical protein JW881_01920 [Spirochaetales bacterium]|nr:hypothetical protein [Spirochaetales bacterium]
MHENRKPMVLLLLLITASYPCFGNAGALFWGMHIGSPSFEDYELDCNFFGFQFYTVSSGGQRLGGFGSLIVSGARPEPYVFGGVTGGVYLGQELVLGPVVTASNLLLGLGVTSSNIGRDAGHIAVIGEAHIEAGFFISDWLQLTCFGGIQSILNLFPSWPSQAYFFYVPVWGIKFAKVE